ncbi:phospholipase/carboxylesterase family protein-like protein [Decorospora gaudefroyi]|uniref:Phospholipase/carboxylesterase family protein-like protein n=1 Tax=Decorospora gaudefroyi TaxID=184978 RepID=A0A6A5KMJ9_9PLEO|nr:phospholipase/carboxylesterase family protein-like protein [Decorospora gaudefroyi]
MSSSKSKPQRTILPLVIPPLHDHKTTMIILHGRGSSAEKFAEPLLTHIVSPGDKVPVSSTELPADGSPTSMKSFQEHFPNTKFVFPTAPLRRAVVFKRSLIHQWFDNWSLTEPELKQHLQVQGLRETTAYLHGLLKDEIEIVGARNVVLMGLSQGCAASIIAMLLWKGERIGALVGMCGYLPFRKGMCDSVDDANSGDTDSLVGSDDDEQEDMFERNDEELGSGSKFEKAVGWLREELGISQDNGGGDEQSSSLQSIPVFMGHGRDDEKVPCYIGKLAADFLAGVDVSVTWQEYAGLGHWYSEDMLRDVVDFVNGLD